MLEIRKKLSEIFSGNKTKVISGFVILLAIVPGIWMPKLKQPPAPSVLGSVDFKLPDLTSEGDNIKKNTQSVIDSFAQQPLVTKTSKLLSTQPKIEEKPIINTKDTLIENTKAQGTKLDLKPLDTLFLKERIPVFGWILYEEGLQKEVYSDKFDIGSTLRITYLDRSVTKTVSAGKPLKFDTQLLVKKSVFEELGIDTAKLNNVTVKIEKI
jgi:hypothetical protein